MYIFNSISKIDLLKHSLIMERDLMNKSRDLMNQTVITYGKAEGRQIKLNRYVNICEHLICSDRWYLL